MRKSPPRALAQPHIRLCGEVDDDMVDRFVDQLRDAGDADPLVIELTTYGGDAEMGRRLALEIRLLRHAGREVLFLGKTTVWSAGVTIMAAAPAPCRWLTPDTVLLIHGRKIQRTIELDGNLRDAERAAKRLLAEVRASLALQKQGFDELLEGCAGIDAPELERVTRDDWYLTADEAVAKGLVAGVWGPAPGAG